MENSDQKPIVGAIIIAGILIAGAILLKGSSAPAPAANLPVNNVGNPSKALAPVGAADRVFGNPQAKITIVMYEDFQCPFCGKFHQESEGNIRNTYVKDGTVRMVYRDFAFLGPESIKAAEAARCAADQGKFWEYHDYLFEHQKGENQGNFSDPRLKSFALNIGLSGAIFNQCLDSNKYAQAVADAKAEAAGSGVNSTPKGFILKNGRTVGTIDGAEPFENIKAKIDSALK